jgi:hypothetical protein
MLEKSLVKNLLVGLSLCAVSALTSCGGGGGGGGSTYGLYSSGSLTANQFVSALNDVDGAPLYDESDIVLYTDETIRSTEPNQEDWFVIYDAKFDEYKAVSLQYVRSVVYYDYYSNDFSAADEFRNIENDDIGAGYINGDLFGDDYEVVDLVGGVFFGRESGFSYEDEEETTDVNLMTGEVEKKQFFQQAANVSYAYSVSLNTAMSLVSLGGKVEGMLKKNESELTAEDQNAIMGDLQELTGVTIEEVVQAGLDGQKKAEVLKKVASKIGTTSVHLEDQILPELFGITL